MSLFGAGAALREILIDSRGAKCCIFQYEMRLQDGTSQVSEAAGARSRFYLRISSDILESSLFWRKQSRDATRKSYPQDFVAGAVFGAVGG